MTPQKAEVWGKRSFPLPTIVSVDSVDGKSVTVKWNRRRYKLAVDLFLAQGFELQRRIG